jgi:branched-chain amino acid transport system permease protein
MELFGIPVQALLGQMVLGLVNGSFYAILSLGLAVIFGMLNIINFTHGAQYMLGAYFSWLGMTYLGLNYWIALLLCPLLVGVLGVLIERLLLRHLYHLDQLYGLLLTFGICLIIEGMFMQWFGVSGQQYPVPESLQGGIDLGFLTLPLYRVWVLVASLGMCLLTWFAIEKTRLGTYLRAATEKPEQTQAFGINVPLLVTLTYGFGVALAGLAGVLAAPMIQNTPLMGSNMIITVFAVVVIGGMGSILGSILTGLGLGLIEGFTKVLYPEFSSNIIFLLMALVLLTRPSGLFGREA